MGRFLYSDDTPSGMYQPPQRIYVPVYAKPPRHYGIFKFLWDCIMTGITGGLWLIWIFVREMRKR